jgi:predicted HTH transcriptional regulator
MEERLKGVIDLIRDNPSISRTAMAAELELTEAQIKTAINILKSRKIIYHEGPAKGGKWIIK